MTSFLPAECDGRHRDQADYCGVWTSAWSPGSTAVIVPETIVCDHSKVFISNNFRSSCRYLGINLQPAHMTCRNEVGRPAHVDLRGLD
ncbi:hypothetical protein [Streptomyces sp. WAC 05379]|uniref:hypothetical protein n=1 Tax=Streptomyces sp. WAC 05379 TaxID=2203207 RepID=UPI000F742E65|nr:hypothetical protein [Streptomyces sp. WAC 05379]